MLGSGRQTRLLAALLLSAGEVVSRDLLIDALWGEQPPATAANALQVQVHSLRKRLGQERIATDGPGYRLLLEPGELDSERFERLVARGRSELAAGDAETSSRTLGEALALWRGPALADVAYEPFALGETARLDELRLVAREERIEAELALARTDVVPELEALVAEHPARERLHGQLMLALYRGGRQADALGAYRRARQLLREELGLEPGPELQELQQAILRQDAALRIEPREVRARRHLPAPQTQLVGRQRELAELGSFLRRQSPRLVTLTGTGGIGKTRLALQAAHDLADAFDDGVFFVDLAPLREPELVPSALADVLGVEEQPGRPLLATLEAHLQERRVLLLLDNFEVVEEAARIVAALLQAAPALAVLVTSRVPLRLTGEHEYRVPPLPLSSAVRLFAERARAVAPGFRRPSEEADEVAELCRRVDRLPLAIELAAARTRDYAPAELLQLFPSTLELASEGARDLPGRHRRLRATIDWSYELLAPEERSLFARLAVFVAGCTASSAAAVCDATRGALASLVAKSLLQERLGADGEPRYVLLETVRAYALERLAESGEEDDLRRRHAEHYAAVADAAEHERGGYEGQKAWEGLGEEQGNFRAALDWSTDSEDVELQLRLAGALAYFWVVRGHLSEGQRRVEAALAHGADAPAPLRARALFGAARFANSLGDVPAMRDFMEQSLAVYRDVGDRWGIARSLDGLGIATSNLGEYERGIELNQESAAIYRELGDDRGLAITLNNLGSVLLDVGDYEGARVRLEEALAVFEGLGLRDRISVVLCNVGHAAFLGDRPDDALGFYRRGIAVAQELEYAEMVIYGLHGVAAVLSATGEAERAATLLGAADAAAEARGLMLEPFESRIHEQTTRALEDALGEEAFAAIHAAGTQIALSDAAADALGQPEQRVPA